MLTARLSWIGFIMLLLVMLLIGIAALYWQHMTGISFSHLLAGGGPGGGQGC